MKYHKIDKHMYIQFVRAGAITTPQIDAYIRKITNNKCRHVDTNLNSNESLYMGYIEYENDKDLTLLLLKL